MAAGDQDEPMPDAPAAAAAAPAAKPRRRFAPQLVEETVKSSGKRQPTPESSASSSRKTKDASVQVNDVEIADTPVSNSKPRRRFVPVPVETTFDSYRVDKNPHGPTAELTPDPSPTTSDPPLLPPVKAEEKAPAKRPKRRFAPQLIETSRRAWRTGQQGPATKPTDKTDITPGTNHIYVPKPKRKPNPAPWASTSGLEVDPKENPSRFVHLAPRRQQSMKPHPNTRRSSRNHSFSTPHLDTIESSESEPEDEDVSKVPTIKLGAPAQPVHTPENGESWATRNYDLRDRRESCDEDFSGYLLAVASREAARQRDIEQALSAFPNGVRPVGVEHFFVRDNSEDDQIPEDEPLRHGTSKLIKRKSTDLGLAEREMRQHAEKLANARGGSQMSVDEDSDQMEIAPPPEDPLWTTSSTKPEARNAEGRSPFAAVSSPHVRPASPKIQPETTGFRSGPFGNPFAAYNNEKEDRELRRMRNAASPPMLGSDLKFRLCSSPKATRLEPDHPYPVHGEATRPQEQNRDKSGDGGLWRGYCIARANQEAISTGLHPMQLIATPRVETLTDPFSAAFLTFFNDSGNASPRSLSSPTKRPSQHKGLHLLSGIDERLKQERVRKDHEDRILSEFNDAFVTQVYNYLSLGYPATARAYDEELSKISGIGTEELQYDDHTKIGKGFMLEMEMKVKVDSSRPSNKSSGDEMRTPEEDEARSSEKPPRWKALKLYIREWARQHPNLDNDGNTLAWGVRERRGSWAI